MTQPLRKLIANSWPGPSPLKKKNAIFHKASHFPYPEPKKQRKTSLVGTFNYFSFPIMLHLLNVPSGCSQSCYPRDGCGQLLISIPDFSPRGEKVELRCLLYSCEYV